MIEQTILSNLVFSNDYCRKTLPFLKAEYFQQEADKLVFVTIEDYTRKYDALPTREALLIELTSKEGISQSIFEGAISVIENLKTEGSDAQWLLDKTEEFCQDKAIRNAILKAINVLESNDGKGTIPKLLSDALAVSFDNHIGHDYIKDATERFEFYHKVEEKISFDLDMFNKITGGGVSRKTLNLFIAGTHVGKSLALCHMAAADLLKGRNVLYITLEMAEERIAERIDANLLDTTMDELHVIPKDTFERRIARLRAKTAGNLVIKEYPTASAHVGHFRHLLSELRLKKSFVPQVIYVDYLNIMSSARVKSGQGVNSYTLVKAIAEELRGLAVEADAPIWSATQTNRQGFGDSDLGMDSTSESFGVPMTADFMAALIVTDELKESGQLLVKQLKNRYGDMNTLPKFIIGIDRAKMRLYNVQQDNDRQDDVSVFDKTGAGEAISQERRDKWRALIT